MLTINDRPVLRFGLEKAQAELISQYLVKEFFNGGTQPQMVQIRDYLVELPGADGQPTRLTIRVRGFGFDLPQPGHGHMVSVLVNRRRTKAAFDPDDPKISLGARHELGKKRRKANAAKDKAEFDRLAQSDD